MWRRSIAVILLCSLLAHLLPIVSPAQAAGAAEVAISRAAEPAHHCCCANGTCHMPCCANKGASQGPTCSAGECDTSAMLALPFSGYAAVLTALVEPILPLEAARATDRRTAVSPRSPYLPVPDKPPARIRNSNA